MPGKYFDGIAKGKAELTLGGKPPPFDLNRLRSTGFAARIAGNLFDYPDWWLSFLRFWRPRLRIGGVVLLTRFRDVEEVMERQADFVTPYGPEMKEMSGGRAEFILGLCYGQIYQTQKKAVLEAFPPDELDKRVRPLARQLAHAAVAAGGQTFDAAGDLMKIVPIQIVRDYYGIQIDDVRTFADWALALSNLFFADPTGARVTRELSVAAAENMLAAIDASLAASLALSPEERSERDRPIDRLANMRLSRRLENDDQVRAIMMGMIAGFAPTNLLGGINCLYIVLKRPEIFEYLKRAVEEDNNDNLAKGILEAMRFKPIWVWPWRYAKEDQIIGKGADKFVIPAKSLVLPATRSAMFDTRVVKDPWSFNPDRDPHDSFVFGRGLHSCIGREMAKVQISEAFRALFERPGFRRAPGRRGRLTRLGAHPEHFMVQFDGDPRNELADQAMVTIAIPVRSDIAIDKVQTALNDFENPARLDLDLALRNTQKIHFASMSVIPTKNLDTPDQPDAHILIELSGDGTPLSVLDAWVTATGQQLAQYLRFCADSYGDVPMRDYLKSLIVETSPGFRSWSGLAFAGAPGHSIKRIIAEATLAEQAKDHIDDWKRSNIDNPEFTDQGRPVGVDASKILQHVRAQLRASPDSAWAFAPAHSKLEAPGGSYRKVFHRMFDSRIGLGLLILIGLCTLATYQVKYGVVSPPAASTEGTVQKQTRKAASDASGNAPGIPDKAKPPVDLEEKRVFTLSNFTQDSLRLVDSFIVAVLGLLAFTAAVFYFGGNRLNRIEEEEIEQTPAIGMRQLAEFQTIEDDERYVQNHLTAVSRMKPAYYRRWLLRFAFFVVSVSAAKFFRPGYLSDINSIHFARWVYLKRTGTLVFLSNYGGSWESYLEDFVTKASNGITGIWSNTKGFPVARWLFFKGSTDADRFKRWARAQQVRTSFWFCAYPRLNTTMIRKNSQIRQGLLNANISDARDWLALFSSSPRQTATQHGALPWFSGREERRIEPLETGEMQAILFGPMGNLHQARLLGYEIPELMQPERRRDLLDAMLAETSFDEIRRENDAMFCALGPDGLKRLGLPTPKNDDAMESFPLAFRQGMGNPYRSRILDDVEESRPEKWKWGNDARPVDVVFVCYGDTDKFLQDKVDCIERVATNAGLIRRVALDLTTNRPDRDKDVAREHFGFADGLSQPVILGTRRKRSRKAAPMHLLAAGEFVFGYPDEYGNYPSSPLVAARFDGEGRLNPVNASGQPTKAPNAPHDFGRNGTFMVIRQLEQHVDRFEKYCVDEGTRIGVTAEWIGSRIVGRWKNGSSVVRYPDAPKLDVENSFSFGQEDPQGRSCPIGAHIRRSNPRDSLGLDLETQLKISKRHRILRVGRSYVEIDDTGQEKKGLLFMCLNASIERQYEFIQQTWMSSANFNGLRGEKDPLIGNHDKCPGRFTIPAWEGAVELKDIPTFVTTRGGGYYFVPSRSALQFLRERVA